MSSIVNLEKTNIVAYTSITFAAIAAWSFYRFISKWRRQSKLYVAIQKRQHEREEIIEIIKERLDSESSEQKEKRNQIQKLALPELMAKLQSDKCSAIEAVHAWQEKAIEAHKKTNAVTLFMKESEEWAKELDEAAKNPNYTKPPLFGVPFSFKESNAVKGYEHTRGYAQILGQISETDAVILTVLRHLGAIPIALTNVPQSLLSFSCSNPIYGTTNNPYNADRTCGGSSGGEAALIGSGGILFGIGGDVGGSIRMPCHFSGIAGIKPSAHRLSKVGGVASIPGRPMICAALGPMAPDVDTIVTLMRLFLRPIENNPMYDLDPYTVPLPFNEKLFQSTKPMTIGYYENDGFFTATPSCRRAVHLAKQALERAGHKLVPWSLPDAQHGIALFSAAVAVDSGKYILDMFANDIMDPHYSQLATFLSIPTRIRPLLARLIGQKRMALIASRHPNTVTELRQVYADIEDYRKKFAKRWTEAGLNAVICPAQACPALPHDMPMKVPGTASYTAIYNMLDCPAGVVPVTKVTKEDEKEMEKYQVVDYWDKLVYKANTNGSVGLPVAVQCVALPFREEITLRLMKQVESNIEK